MYLDRKNRIIILILVVFIFGANIFAQTSTVDAAFTPALTQDVTANYNGNSVIQPDGKIIIFGSFLSSPGGSYIMRLNPDGSLDSSFNCTVCAGVSTFRNAILQPDGKLLVAAVWNGSKILRLNTDGSPDQSFDASFAVPSGGTTDPTIYGLQPDGKIIARYFAYYQDGFHDDNIVRLNTNGSVDTSFNRIAYGGRLIWVRFTTGFVLPDGKILAAFRQEDGIADLHLYRYNINGTVDTTFELPSFASPEFSINDISLYPDGKFMASGYFSNVNSTNRKDLVRLFSAGNVDTSFNVDASIFEASAPHGGNLEVLPDGKILFTTAAGGGLEPNPNVDNRFYRLNANGSVDNLFNPPLQLTRIHNFTLDNSGRILVFGMLSGVLKYLRLNADGSLDSGFNLPILVQPGLATAVAIQPDGKIIVGGNFNRVGGALKGKIARLNPDGTTDSSFNTGSGFDVAPFSIVLQPDGKILALGDISTYNGSSVLHVVRLNSDGSLDAAFHPDFNGAVHSVSLYAGGKIVFAGNFTTVNGLAQSKVAILNADGSVDTNFAPSFSLGFVNSVFAQADGKIMAGGTFPAVNGFNRPNLVRLNADGTLDAAFNAGSIAAVEYVLQQSDGKYLIAHSGSIERRNNNGTTDAGFQASSFTGAPFKALLLQPDGTFLVGGTFTSVTGGAAKNIARFTANGILDPGFLPDGANNTVNAIARQADGNLIVGGVFSSIANVARTGIARITVAPIHVRALFDFDGDGKADVSVFRPSENKWYILRSSDLGVTQQVFAIAGDVPVPADYDGDGKTDLAIFRPGSGDWWSLSSINGAQIYAHWGQSGVISRPSDFDGDGRADYIYFLPSNSTWYRYGSMVGYSPVAFGLAGDKPVTGDFDGDGKTDVAIYRPSTGDWWWKSSLNGAQLATHWGISTDIPAPADFDGDGKTDFAVYRPSTGVWYIYNSGSLTSTIMNFGISEDKPVPADYDGDGKADIAVFRPSTGVWYLQQSTAGFWALNWGISTDIPTENAFVP
jgi:uncharacterized delta-60 repeat protein